MKKIIFYLIMSSLLFGCSNSDDSDDPNILDGAYISANVNGNPFLASSNDLGFMVISADLVESDFLFTMGITGVDLDDDLSGQGQGIALAFAGPDFDSVTESLEIIDDEIGSDYIFAGSYGFTSSSGEDQDFEYVENSGYIKITAIDKNAQTLSGEFSYTVIEEVSGTTFEITQGILNDIEYTIGN